MDKYGSVGWFLLRNIGSLTMLLTAFSVRVPMLSALVATGKVRGVFTCVVVTVNSYMYL